LRSLRFLLFYGLMIVIEVPVVAAIYPGERRRMALSCLLATTATWLILKTMLFISPFPRGWVVMVGEAVVLGVEAGVYAITSRAHDLPRAFVASALANGLSFGLGLLIPPLP
jgi:hypothetical protein